MIGGHKFGLKRWVDGGESKGRRTSMGAEGHHRHREADGAASAESIKKAKRVDVRKLRQEELHHPKKNDEVLQRHAARVARVSGIDRLHAQPSHNLNGNIVAYGRNLLKSQHGPVPLRSCTQRPRRQPKIPRVRKSMDGPDAIKQRKRSSCILVQR